MCHQSSRESRFVKVILKFKNLVWIVLIFIILLTQNSVVGYFQLNQNAVNFTKVSFGDKNKNQLGNTYLNVKVPLLECHFHWIELSLNSGPQSYSSNNQIGENMVRCSKVFMRMVRFRYPLERNLAELAVQMYPDDTFPLYWLAESMGKKTTPEKKPIFERILAINPKDGVAWRYMGIIYVTEKNIPAAIQAHINSCMYGDPGSNGCFNAGVLFEQIGDYENALYYYRLSRWIKSQEAADMLEAKLSEN